MVETGEALSCDEPKIRQTGTSCNPFTSGDKPEPSSECCQSYKELRALAKTTEERRKYCSCAQEAITQNKFNRGAPNDLSIRIPRTDALPEKCGLPFLFPVGDCVCSSGRLVWRWSQRQLYMQYSAITNESQCTNKVGSIVGGGGLYYSGDRGGSEL